MLIKTINIKNPKNVIVQIPGFVSATWNLTVGSELEMHYNHETNKITIKPMVLRRGNATE